MPAPLSMDLRRRIVDAYENGEGTYSDMAERFDVGEATVSRLLKRNRYGGDLTPNKAGGDRRSVRVPDEVAQSIEGLVRDEPNWTTQELADQVKEDFGLSITRQQVGKLLHSLGFSFKRGSSDHGHPPSQLPSHEGKPTPPNRGTWTHPSSYLSTKQASLSG